MSGMIAKKMFIDGDWTDGVSGEFIDVTDPSTGQNYLKIPEASEEDIDSAVDAARDAFEKGVWSRIPPSERARVLLKLADLLESRSAQLAEMETRNTGKSLRQSSNYDIPYAIDNIRFLAGASREMDGFSAAEYNGEGTSFLKREPVGVIAVITPWNYPFILAAWRVAAALAVGNSVVVKPSSLTPVTTLEFAEAATKVGIPKGVLNVVTGKGSRAGEKLAASADVDMIAFTGSTEVGSRLQEIGSRTIKKVSLELGGKAPFIVFEDADIDAATEGAVVGGIINNGQDCANATRFYVHRSVLESFLDLLARKLAAVRVGDPFDMSSDMGPMISSVQRERTEYYIKKGIEEGANVLFGGDRPRIEGHEGGYFIRPSLLYTENENSAIVKEEIFGPVLTVLPFEDYEDVISRSNSVKYGLCASVWTKDASRGMRAIRDLRFGTVWLNDHLPVPSETPWAGYKQSGIGVSMSKYGLEEFTLVKHAYVDMTGKVRKSWYYQVFGG